MPASRRTGTVASIVALAVAAIAVSGCGGHAKSSSGLVWCVAPGEAVTAELKRDYPELLMSRAACDEANR